MALVAALKPQTALIAEARSLETSDFFRRDGLLYLPAKEVEAKTDQLIEAQPFLGALASDPSLRGFAGALGLMARGGKEAAGLAKPLASIGGALDAANKGAASDFSWSALFSGEPPGSPRQAALPDHQAGDGFPALQPGSDASDAVRATAEKIGLTPEPAIACA